MSMYPLPRLRPYADKRFTSALVSDVVAALEKHGYPPVRTGSDLVRLQRNLAAFLYDDPVVPGGPPPPRPGSRSDDWYGWINPEPQLAEYDKFGREIDMPPQFGGASDYASAKRWGYS